MTLWDKLSHLPTARHEDRRTQSGQLKPVKKRKWRCVLEEYSALSVEPLMITAHLVTPVIQSQQVALDGLLSWARLTAHPVETFSGDGGHVIPLPLHLSDVLDGYPVWCASLLMPVTEGCESREYWHKRYPTDRADYGRKQSANTTAGRYKEYRTPVRAQSVSRLHAVAVGHQAEIERLLELVTHIGKKGSMGYGRVARWHVERTTMLAEQDVLHHRPMPTDIWSTPPQPERYRLAPRWGWTPPYWYAPLWRECWVPR